eukprot:GCRY01000859.1.p2 GENE.GCRY01000859.1~~GCRY01000859.1.p2  ORF type:complete len:131 (-),score=23.35 GCRY01000859.1:14-406(-)
MKTVLSTLAVAFFVTAGIAMNVLVGIVNESWMPAVLGAIYVLVVLPSVIFDDSPKDSVFGTQDSWENVGQFLTSCFSTSFIAAPLVFYHTHLMTLEGVLICFGGGVMFVAGAFIYIFFVLEKHEETIPLL